VNGVMQENLSGIRLIKAFQQDTHEQSRFDGVSERLMEHTKAALRVTESTMPVILLVMNTGIMVALWLGRQHIQAGEASVGEVVAIVNYATRTTGALSIMSMIIMNFTRARTSAARITEVLLVEESVQRQGQKETDPSATEGAISFRHVSFRYPNTETDVLIDISFTASVGETVAIMGATGSGKTTLLQLIPRLYEPDDGSITMNGIDIRDMDTETLRRSIGYVPQEVLLFSGTVNDNIRWGREDASQEDIVAAARDAQIHETALQLKNGYDTVMGQKGVTLSGGQKQRLSIARALVRRPKVLLLDDSTSALDVRTESQLLEALKSYPCTTIMVTQKISATMGVDRILLLEDGRLIANGTHEVLLKNSALYQRIYRSQLREESVSRA
jgi:ATP-binding cassette subfamily B multidrug efflux pump